MARDGWRRERYGVFVDFPRLPYGALCMAVHREHENLL